MAFMLGQFAPDADGAVALQAEEDQRFQAMAFCGAHGGARPLSLQFQLLFGDVEVHLKAQGSLGWDGCGPAALRAGELGLGAVRPYQTLHTVETESVETREQPRTAVDFTTHSTRQVFASPPSSRSRRH